LNNDFSVDCVVTNPDRPSGRGMRLVPSPVKQFALEKGIPVMEDLGQFLNEFKVQSSRFKVQGSKFKVDNNKSQNNLEPRTSNLELNNPLLIVVAYGKILPPELVNNFTCVNLHASLLPGYRGASPIQSVLLNGEEQTGVSTMLITEKMDARPVLLQREVTIEADETSAQLHDKLAGVGVELLVETIRRLDALKPIPQDDAQATYCHKIWKEDRLLDLRWDAQRIHNTVRAIGGYFYDGGKRVVVTRTRVKDKTVQSSTFKVQGSSTSDSEPKTLNLEPGTLNLEPRTLNVEQSIPERLETLSRYLDIWVRPEGKNEMMLAEYLRGRK